MNRDRALKIVLVGLLFLAGVYPVTDSLWHANQSMYTEDMMLSLYVTLGIFLLLASGVIKSASQFTQPSVHSSSNLPNLGSLAPRAERASC
jgi:hypothetical protein